MNKLHINIRPANLNDAVSIATIGYNSWQDTYRGLIPEECIASINISQQIDACGLAIKNGKIFLVASNDLNYAIGYTQIGVGKENPKENEVYALYVSKHARSQGVGGLLLFEAERYFADTKPVLIRTLRDNIRARKFFKTNGYRYVPGRDGLFKNVAPDVAFLKNII